MNFPASGNTTFSTLLPTLMPTVRVIWCGFFKGTRRFLAISGKDGSFLWNQPVKISSSVGHNSDIALEPAVSDIDRDGRRT